MSVAGERNDGPYVVVELTEQLLPLAARLVAQHLRPEQDVAATVERAAANLRHLLDWPSAQLFLALNSDDIVGFASVHWGFSTRHGQPFLRIQDIYTHPDHRRRGVARVLIAYLSDYAREHDNQRLELVTGTGNAPARALYTSLGFEWFPEKEVYMRFLR
jgi:ribosomal protein S18 acetylase RimI-like enzyme